MNFRIRGGMALALLALAPVAVAEIVLLEFGYFVRHAGHVVIGRVDNTRKDAGETPFIDVTVLETWRGQSQERLEINISRTDVSSKRPWPRVGERALIVFDVRDSWPWPMLSMFGLGYLPIRTFGSQEYVCGIWHADLPASIGMKEGPGEDGNCYDLDGLRSWARQ